MKQITSLLLLCSAALFAGQTNETGIFIPVNPDVYFSETAYSISEDESEVTITLELSEASVNEITVDVDLVTELQTATPGTDFTFSGTTVTFPANSTSQDIIIPITDNEVVSNDKVFLLELSNPTDAFIDEDFITGVYIIDNDRELVYPTSPEIEISYETSYLVDEEGSAEIVAYNADNQIMYVLNSDASSVEVLDFSSLENITLIKTIDLSGYGTDGATSVAYKDGMVVASLSNGPETNGVVVFMNTYGFNVSTVEVGNLPDNVSFTPDGTKVLTANEGQPNDDYDVDPEGSISIIDVTAGLGNIVQDDVATLNFNDFDSQIDALRTSGVRITGPDGTTVSQDVEPEYVTYSDDSQTAWVSLQENNALAVVDITSEEITDILPLGVKDHSLPENSLDTSDKTDFIFMANWPIKGMYMPDAIAQYEVDGIPYIITANEGDGREYDGYEDETKLGKDDYQLDPAIFPEADLLKLDSNLGRLLVTNANGNTDADEEFEEIYTYGTRSFSIRNGNTGALVYDSGDDFERYTAADETYGVLFNTSNSKNKFKDRSDAKGPEPEGVTTAKIGEKIYAFITLERVGGFMTYDVTDPQNPIFIKYMNNRDLGEDEGGDLGPEGIIYIAPEVSPNEMGLIIMANEVSSTISVYSIEEVETLSIDEFATTEDTFKVYPNPIASDSVLNLNKNATVTVFDITGRTILSVKDTNKINLLGVKQGTYILKTNTGESTMLIVK